MRIPDQPAQSSPFASSGAVSRLLPGAALTVAIHSANDTNYTNSHVPPEMYRQPTPPAPKPSRPGARHAPDRYTRPLDVGVVSIEGVKEAGRFCTPTTRALYT